MIMFQWSFAQKSVSGTVSDSAGVPLPGATVVVDGTSNGVTEMNMYYGLGVSYNTAEEGVELRLEYEEFGTAGGTDTERSDRPDEVDPTNISISLIKKF